MFFLGIAGLSVKVDNLYGYVARVCEGYTVAPTDNYDIEVKITDEDLADEPQPESFIAPPHVLERCFLTTNTLGQWLNGVSCL